jgi:MOSC domain-containing protein YiiM
MDLISIQVGVAETLQVGDRAVTTGIGKRPVDAAEVEVGGIVGDTIVDTEHHGGVDQAVYVYGDHDYDWWRRELRRYLAPGTFGENLTFSDFGNGAVHIGDRWVIGDVVLETTGPRIPCAVLGAQMGDGEFAAKFRAAARPGFYARVVHPGALEPGMPVRKIPSSGPVGLLEVFELAYETGAARDCYERVLSAPISERTRDSFVRRMERTSD